jgi:hypothetical protein
MKRLLDWLFRRKNVAPEDVVLPELGMSANGYKQALDNEWDRYLKWRDEQVCVNCGKKFGSEKGMSVAEWVDSGMSDLDDSMWVTETQCVPCWKKHGSGGKSRADMLAETGNIYL